MWFILDCVLTRIKPCYGLLTAIDRASNVQIISARQADRRERKDYEDGNFP